MRRECRERFSRHRLPRKTLVSDPGMHPGTCVMHVPWCMSGSLSRGDGEFEFVRNRMWNWHGKSAVKHVLLVCWFFRFFAGKIARALQRECSFSSEKSNELTDQQNMYFFNHAFVFFSSNKIEKMLINNKFEAQTLTGNSRCHTLTLVSHVALANQRAR